MKPSQRLYEEELLKSAFSLNVSTVELNSSAMAPHDLPLYGHYKIFLKETVVKPKHHVSIIDYWGYVYCYKCIVLCARWSVKERGSCRFRQLREKFVL